MFSGIIEETGAIQKIIRSGSNLELWISCSFTADLKPEESIAHNGVCLTVEEIDGGQFKVTAIDETLKKTNLGRLEAGDLVNLERSLTLEKLIHGHVVQGHVDSVSTCLNVEDAEGSHVFTFNMPADFQALIVEKGSIAINGVSLTAFNCYENSFSVAIIPYTWQHTNFHRLLPSGQVNLEFDILGKYVNKWLSVHGSPKS